MVKVVEPHQVAAVATVDARVDGLDFGRHDVLEVCMSVYLSPRPSAGRVPAGENVWSARPVISRAPRANTPASGAASRLRAKARAEARPIESVRRARSGRVGFRRGRGLAGCTSVAHDVALGRTDGVPAARIPGIGGMPRGAHARQKRNELLAAGGPWVWRNSSYVASHNHEACPSFGMRPRPSFRYSSPGSECHGPARRSLIDGDPTVSLCFERARRKALIL